MTPITITLPWPARALSPNCRAHWAVKHIKAKAYKDHATLIATIARKHASLRRWMPGEAAWAKVDVQFTPPTAARRDQDNLIASMKSAFDGIAQAIGIDDSRWRLGTIEITAPRRPGCVTVTIEPVEVA